MERISLLSVTTEAAVSSQLVSMPRMIMKIDVKRECMTVKSEKIIIGTRGSPLALWQANFVKDKLAKISQYIQFDIKVINTSGDWRPQDGEVRLKESEGGKGQFAKEIEEALLAGVVDIGVHSMKDMETVQPQGLEIPFILEREDPRDAFLSDCAQTIEDLPIGAVVGTASMRRGAFLLNMRPDLKVVPFRGNVHTRIEKLRAGQVDATLLACAGLKRLGLGHEVASIVPENILLPAVAQGAIGIEIRSQDRNKLSFIDQLNCLKTNICVAAERSFLAVLNGSCHTPVGVLATIEVREMTIKARVVSPDGVFSYADRIVGQVSSLEQAVSLGVELGGRMKPHIPEGIL